MSTLATLDPVTQSVLERQAGQLANAKGMVPEQFRGKPNEIIAVGLYGQALGLDLIIALQSVSVINGKPSLDASGWSALIRQRGHSITADEHTDKVCTLTGKRADNGDTFTASFTWDDATAARLTSKDTWKKHPKDMLFARALTALGRRLFSDIAIGGMYTPEELSPATVEVLEVIDAVELEPVDTSAARAAYDALPFEVAARLAEWVLNATGANLTHGDGWAELDQFWVDKITEQAGKAATSGDAGGSESPTGSPANSTYDRPVDQALELIPEYRNGEEPF